MGSGPLPNNSCHGAASRLRWAAASVITPTPWAIGKSPAREAAPPPRCHGSVGLSCRLFTLSGGHLIGDYSPDRGSVEVGGIAGIDQKELRRILAPALLERFQFIAGARQAELRAGETFHEVTAADLSRQLHHVQ